MTPLRARARQSVPAFRYSEADEIDAPRGRVRAACYCGSDLAGEDRQARIPEPAPNFRFTGAAHINREREARIAFLPQPACSGFEVTRVFRTRPGAR